MNIPKGTAKAIFQDTNRIYLQNFGLWIRMSLPWWTYGGVMYFFYLNNGFVVNWLNQIFGLGFVFVDIFMTFTLAVMLAVSLVVIILVFDILHRGQKVPSMIQTYATASKLLWPLVCLKFRYLWRVIWKMFLLIVPGVFAFTDGVAYYMAFLYDHKQGREAIVFSDKVVQINRSRYWDYLLMGFLIPGLVMIPFVLLMDQLAYVLRLNNLYDINLLVNAMKFVVFYFALLYVLLFHSRVYAKFKTFLSQS